MPASLSRKPTLAASEGSRGLCLADRIRAVSARFRRHGRCFRFADSGIAATEFVLLLPTLLFILFCGAQLITYIDATRKVDLVAYSVSQMVSQLPPPINGSIAKVNSTDLRFSYDSTLVLFPYVMADARLRGVKWQDNISINFASIEFRPKDASCKSKIQGAADASACYEAKVVWTSSGSPQPSDGPNFRPCSTSQRAMDDKAPPNRAALPRSAFGPLSLVVIDVVFTFRPTFGARFLPAIRIARSAYVQPRYAALVSYDTTNSDGIAVTCPGY
ncbi:pilus assembly protein [Methylobacterium organophilum]|uniref:pilus assembly protein n=1 Tax=Methylobacterium organophilum TaxID=410 RepID=UPI001F12D3B7|nr:pilus assembly protein [Methylobacterium organophilum]UMY18706.1 pilus assembly protein [Methylobacterium organophilum]